MNAYALAAIFTGGGIGLGALVMYGLYLAGYWGGEAAARQKITAASAARIQRQDVVLQKEVTNDDLRKSLEDGTF